MKEVGEDAKPLFEKHKIFLYREDMANFKSVFLEALDFVENQQEASAAEENLGLNAILSDLDVDL